MSETRQDDTLITYNKAGIEVARGTVGKNDVVINSLTPATNYAKGDFQIAFSDNDGISHKIDVPAFTTKPQLVESFTLNPGDVVGHVGDNLDIKVTTLSPGDATDKVVKAVSKNPTIANIEWNDSAKTFQAHLLTVGTTEFDWTSNDGNASVKQTVKVEEKPASTNVAASTPGSGSSAPSSNSAH